MVVRGTLETQDMEQVCQYISKPHTHTVESGKKREYREKWERIQRF